MSMQFSPDETYLVITYQSPATIIKMSVSTGSEGTILQSFLDNASSLEVMFNYLTILIDSSNNKITAVVRKLADILPFLINHESRYY